MPLIALSCPQCGGALPRQARWRMVNCPFCAATVTCATDLVHAAVFHEAWQRAQASILPAELRLDLGQVRYRVLAQLAVGEVADVFLADRMSCLPERVVIKLGRESGDLARFQREREVLDALQGSETPGTAYFSQRLPQVVTSGQGRLNGGSVREALVFRHATGYWGSLAEVLRFYPSGIDPRHVVWMWRRVLEVLGFVHAAGWTHGDLRSGHWLVHPDYHGIRLLGWHAASPRVDSSSVARDLMQSAWTVRELLCGRQGSEDAPDCGHMTPAPLVALIKHASEDARWCGKQGAQGLDEALKAAARDAFGPPQFVHFSPTNGAT